jgi:hypothetical protein
VSLLTLAVWLSAAHLREPLEEGDERHDHVRSFDASVTALRARLPSLPHRWPEGVTGTAPGSGKVPDVRATEISRAS